MKKKLKIGLFLDSFYPHTDGVVVVVDNLARKLSKDNDVTLIVPETDKDLSYDKFPYKIITIKSHRLLNTEYQFSFKPSRFSKKYKDILSENFDVVHIHSPFLVGRVGLMIAKDLNIPSIITMHTQFDYEVKKILKKDFIVKPIVKNIMSVYNKCDYAISVNNRTGNLYKINGYKYEPHTIYNGTDICEVKDKKKAIKTVNELYNLKEDENVLLFVGRLTEIKNIFFILDSLKLLKENDVKFKMIYVGFGPDEEKLKQKIHEYNMENEVIMAGKINDRQLLASIYYRADLFLFPSTFDACSLVQIEAATNETPGLFIEGSATSETIIDNVNGYLSKEDRNEYKNRIKKILKDKKELKKVSKSAKKMLSRNFDDVTKETYEFYLKAIEKKTQNK